MNSAQSLVSEMRAQWSELARRWHDTRSQWHDQAAARFEAEHWRTLEQDVPKLLDAMDAACADLTP